MQNFTLTKNLIKYVENIGERCVLDLPSLKCLCQGHLETYLCSAVIEDPHDTDGNQFGTGPSQCPPPKGKYERNVLLVTQIKNVVESIIQTTCQK